MAVCPYTVYTSSSDGAAVNMLICASSLNPVCAFAGIKQRNRKSRSRFFFIRYLFLPYKGRGFALKIKIENWKLSINCNIYSCIYDKGILFSILKAAYSLLNSETIHSKTIAPMVDITRLPITPFTLSPSRPNSHPPNTPPIIPTIRFTINPNPLPFNIFPARKPARIPIIIEPIIPIIT